MKPILKVSAVIPTYNGLHLLKKNLPAVFACLSERDEVVIIDDAGSDLTSKWLIETFNLKEVPRTEAEKGLPREFTMFWARINVNQKELDLTFIQNHLNQRFAAACNRAVEQANNRLIFLLNNDVSPHPDCLQYLIPYFDDRYMFGVGCLEIEGDKIGGRNKLWFERGVFVHSRADKYETGATAWVSGGSGLFDKKKWLELGGFDQAYYPAYWEDIDLSFRAKQKGWKVWFHITLF